MIVVKLNLSQYAIICSLGVCIREFAVKELSTQQHGISLLNPEVIEIFRWSSPPQESEIMQIVKVHLHQRTAALQLQYIYNRLQVIKQILEKMP